MFLPVTQPLDLGKSLESGQVFLWRRHEPWFCGLVGYQVMHLRQRGRGLEVEGGPAPPETLARLLESYLRLDDPLPEIYRYLGREPRLRRALRRHRGLRLLRQEPWECLLSFVCSIDSNIPRIRRNLETLAFQYGHAVAWKGCTHHTLPLPQDLARLSEASLRALGLGFRARYLLPLARMVAQGRVNLERLCSCPAGEARKALLELPGVGEKVADCVLLFSLEKLAAFPVDRWVRRALVEGYLGGQRLSDRALRAWAQEQFGPYAGYAQQYLFYQQRLEAGRTFGVG